MATLTELTLDEELTDLREVATSRGTTFTILDPVRYLLGFPASDERLFHLLVVCDGYPVRPPAWHWCNADATRVDHAADIPSGSGYFHPNQVICAPWNRLAYATVNARGPHSDWTIGDWQNNPQTQGCTTLAHMALRLYVELNSSRYLRRPA